MVESSLPKIEKFFTLDEAVSLLPQVRKDLEAAHEELQLIQDEIVLYKRMHLISQDEAFEETLTKTLTELQQLNNEEYSPGMVIEIEAEEEPPILEQKWKAYEACLTKWVHHFSDQGILLRDMSQGLIDFPYRASKKPYAGKVFMLCWHLEDEGLFYFHEPQAGIRGRQPISLLPE